MFLIRSYKKGSFKKKGVSKLGYYGTPGLATMYPKFRFICNVGLLGADPGFFSGGGATLTNDVTDR